MKVIQSYQQGSRHISKNQPCEDRTYYLSENGVDAIALADGAGSQKYTHSANGAECITETVCKFLCSNFEKFYEKEDINNLKSIIMTVCHKKLFEVAEQLNLDSIARLSSTLLAVAVKGDKVIVCHIGDGVIGKLTPRGTEVVSAPDNGEFASTTYFITNPKADEYINIIKCTVDDTYSYFLMSDGTSEYIYDESNQKFHDAACKMALLPIKENGQAILERTIKEFMIDKDSSSDDCSFICLSIKDHISERNLRRILPQKSSEPNDEENKNDNVDSLIEDESKSQTDEDDKKQDSAEQRELISKSKVIIFTFVFVIAMLSAFISGIITKSLYDKHKAQTTTQVQTTTSSVEESKPEENSLNSETTEESKETSSITESSTQDQSDSKPSQQNKAEESPSVGTTKDDKNNKMKQKQIPPTGVSVQKV